MICMDKLLSKKDTSMLKGFSILMILYHHLFGRPERLAMCHLIAGKVEYYFLLYSALAGKIGVAIFLILSGYGINERLRNHDYRHIPPSTI